MMPTGVLCFNSKWLAQNAPDLPFRTGRLHIANFSQKIVNKEICKDNCNNIIPVLHFEVVEYATAIEGLEAVLKSEISDYYNGCYRCGTPFQCAALFMPADNMQPLQTDLLFAGWHHR